MSSFFVNHIHARRKKKRTNNVLLLLLQLLGNILIRINPIAVLA